MRYDLSCSGEAEVDYSDQHSTASKMLRLIEAFVVAPNASGIAYSSEMIRY